MILVDLLTLGRAILCKLRVPPEAGTVFIDDRDPASVGRVSPAAARRHEPLETSAALETQKYSRSKECV